MKVNIILLVRKRKLKIHTELLLATIYIGRSSFCNMQR